MNDLIGRKVIYQPYGRGPEAREEGVVTGVTEMFLMVRYGSDYGSKATLKSDLTFLDGEKVSDVD